MGKLEGKVAFITGAARGQGRSHAVRLAEEGADIIAVDICRDIPSIPYALATEDDLAETVAAVEKLDRRIVATVADVRDKAALQDAVQTGLAQFGRLDIIISNAGVGPIALPDRQTPNDWQDAIDVNLTGTHNAVEAALPAMIEGGEGGSIVLVSSTGGLAGIGGPAPGMLGYAASKHGVVGLMRSYANNNAQYSIRVNSLHPTGVETPMVVNEATQAFLASDPTLGNAMVNALPIPMLQPGDISDAVLWLVSDEAKYVTGVALPVDAGFLNKK